MALAALLLAGLTWAVAPEGPDHRHLLLGASAACWLAAFGLFLIEYGPMLVSRTAKERTSRGA